MLSEKSIKIQKNTDSMVSEPRSRFRSFRTGLRVRVALGVALPILLILISLSLMRYQYERRLLANQVQLTALQLGEAMVGSLRHTMLIDNHAILAQALNDIGGIEEIQQVQVVDLDGRVIANNQRVGVGTIRQQDDLGCRECHHFSAESRPRATILSTSADMLRIAIPLVNDSDCVGCHKQADSHLGMLLIDMPAVNIEEYLRQNLRSDLAVSIGATILVTVGLYLLIHWLVVRRVEAFRPALAKLAAGDFTARLPSPATPTDELGQLAVAFNHMANELERRARDKEERSKLRQQIIAEERGRIARELHDGLAQLLGYVNTKAMAVRLMLKNRQLEAADQTLAQLEQAVRGLFVEVRKAILDLKTAGQDEAKLVAMFKDYTTRFSLLSDLPVEFTFAPAIKSLSLTTDTKLQLLRIVQEALANVHKHASATRAYVSLQTDGKILELTISDDGLGFEPNCLQVNSPPHFGLSTMRERAEAIDAEFNLYSKPGAGTRIIVCLPLEDLS